MTPKLIIHGGCGKFEGQHSSYLQYDEALRKIVTKGYARLAAKGARAAVIYTMRLLEDEAMFNAGYGSKLQEDGTARMSAAFMDGEKGRFSGVINVENVRNPINIAKILNTRKHTVIAGTPAEAFARKVAIPVFNPITPHRLKEHLSKRKGESGTCGVVALDEHGVICVATSTGGIGYEVPGRVGDTPTVAGTYASRACGVSCTGVGEHIVNQAVASRIVTIVDSSGELREAAETVINEGNRRKSRFGLIALDHNGTIHVGQTQKVTVLAAWHNGAQVSSFLKNQ